MDQSGVRTQDVRTRTVMHDIFPGAPNDLFSGMFLVLMDELTE